MYAKNNLIPRICFYPEVGISKRKSWQFSAERSEEKLETDPSPSYQLEVYRLLTAWNISGKLENLLSRQVAKL